MSVVSGRRSTGRTFTKEQWDAQRKDFEHYYIDKGLSLKEAAECMKTNHGFEATPRQWERRIAPENWGLQKYENRETRLKQIEAAGKSLLEVSSRGRRKSTGSSDGGSSLLVNDRNMRRFARREVSRESRRRAHSVSEASDRSENDATKDPAPSNSAIVETTYNLDFQQALDGLSNSDSHCPDTFSIPAWKTAVESNDSPQVHVIQHSGQGLGHGVPEIFISVPDGSGLQIHPDTQWSAMMNDVNDFGGPSSIPENMQSFDTQQTYDNNTSDASFGNMNPTMDDIAHYSQSSNMNWDDSFASQGSNTIHGHMTQPEPSFQTNNIPLTFDDILVGNSTIDMVGPENMTQGISMSTPGLTYGTQGPPSSSVNHPSSAVSSVPDQSEPGNNDLDQLLNNYTQSARMMEIMVTKCVQHYGQQESMQMLLQLGALIRVQSNQFEREFRVFSQNKTSTQQRAIQAMKATCTKLRSKNEFLSEQNQMLQNNNNFLMSRQNELLQNPFHGQDVNALDPYQLLASDHLG